MSEQDQTADATSEVDSNQIDNAETTTDTDNASGETAGEDELGDAGKQALARMKQRVKDAEIARKAEKARADALESAAALRDKPAEEQALEAARAEARTEAINKANERILRADLRAAATGRLADPTDAALYVNLADFTVNDDGETDSDALTEAIDELLVKKPHLAAGKTARFDGAADQGAKDKASKPKQLTDADLLRMSPQEINAARRDGLLKNLGA